MQFTGRVKHIDLPGETLLPGLIDMHVHLTSLAEIGGYQGLKYTDNFWTAVGVANAKTTLDAGFTTVRNVGSSDFDDVALQAGDRRRLDPGPRIVPATYAIGATGGHCDDTGLPPYYDKKAASVISGPEDAREKVRWLHKYGAEVIKICATGGVFSLGDSVGAQQLSLEEMKAIADEAHMLGLRVAAHAHGDAGIHDAILAGIDTIEHASLASDATHPARQAARHLVRHGYLQRRLHPRDGHHERHRAGEHRQGADDRPQAAPDLPARGPRRA